MNVLKNPVYMAAAVTLTSEVSAYYAEHSVLTEGDCWRRLVRALSAALQVDVREADLEDLLDEIEAKAVCEDDRAELGWLVGEPEYAPTKSAYLAKCDELINEKCRQILWARFVPAPIPALEWAA